MLMILFGHTCSDEACVTSINTLALFGLNIKANLNKRDSCFTLFGYGVKYRGFKIKSFLTGFLLPQAAHTGKYIMLC